MENNPQNTGKQGKSRLCCGVDKKGRGQYPLEENAGESFLRGCIFLTVRKDGCVERWLCKKATARKDIYIKIWRLHSWYLQGGVLISTAFCKLHCLPACSSLAGYGFLFVQWKWLTAKRYGLEERQGIEPVDRGSGGLLYGSCGKIPIESIKRKARRKERTALQKGRTAGIPAVRPFSCFFRSVLLRTCCTSCDPWCACRCCGNAAR